MTMQRDPAKARFGQIPRYLAYALLLLVFLFPIYYMTISALKTRFEIETEQTFYPHQFYFGNIEALFSGVWARCIQNSVTISLLCIAVTLLVSFPAAYVFSRTRFMADKHFFFWLLTNRMAPAACFVVPLFATWTSLGLFDTVPGMVLAYNLFNLPLATWLLVSFMQTIPREIDEAAFIDGHNIRSYFRRVFIPLMRPGIVVVAFFTWMYSWTEMLLANFLTSSAAKTLTANLMLTIVRIGYGVDWGMAASAGLVTIVPALILFYWVRKYLAKGFTFGRV